MELFKIHNSVIAACQLICTSNDLPKKHDFGQLNHESLDGGGGGQDGHKGVEVSSGV